MKLIHLGIAFVLLVLGCGYYKFMYTPHILREATQKALDDFSAAVATKDRAKVGASLSAHLMEGAKIHLEVTFFSLTQNQQKPVVEDFTKAEFLTFIDNVLYPLDDYEYTPELGDFSLNSERNAAGVTFTSSEWADGKSHYAGVAVGMRFSSNSECEGHVLFANKIPSIDTVSCKLELRAVPKPEEAYKIQSNPEAMQQLLMR